MLGRAPRASVVLLPDTRHHVHLRALTEWRAALGESLLASRSGQFDDDANAAGLTGARATRAGLGQTNDSPHARSVIKTSLKFCGSRFDARPAGFVMTRIV